MNTVVVERADRLATTALAQQDAHFVDRMAAVGGHMLVKIALLLLIAWVLVIVAYDARPLVHGLLLAGLWLLLLTFATSRDAAIRGRVGEPPEK